MKITRLVIVLGVLAIVALQALAADQADVNIKNRTYTPAKVRIAAGGTVTWTNSDNLDHTVVASDGTFQSGTLKPGDTYSHTFNKKGTYTYGCRLHPRMGGTVIVE